MRLSVFLLTVLIISISCAKKTGGTVVGLPLGRDTVFDETGCLYTSYSKLVMAGYQGWFAAEGDGSGRGWYHLQNGRCGGFKPGCSSVDFYPDMQAYPQQYKTAFQYPDGSPVHMYSPFDESAVDLHFKWMRDYGIDGVFMQRFVVEIKESNPKGKRHFNKVLENALKAARKYSRAICVMYDLTGCTPADVAYVEKDWAELQQLFRLFDNTAHPSYLRHNKKPLVSIWGVGFNDNRKYTIADAARLIARLKGDNNRVSVMLGVPYYWRTLAKDTENSPALHELAKRCDIVMPWAVGRYSSGNYAAVAEATLAGDVAWCNTHRVSYVPLVFPGFSWGNLKNDPSLYNSIPRLKGDFLWQQVAGVRQAGAQALYVAMFDEIDEGTAIYKCAREAEMPLHGDKKFVGIENELGSDYYLWLTGQAGRWLRGAPGFGVQKPVR